MNRVVHIILSLLLIISLSAGFSADAAGQKYNMSYLYFGNYSGYINYVDKAKGALNEISPNYFDLNSDGSLLLTASLTDRKESEKFIKNMHDKGILVVPFISNHWDYKKGLKALNNMQSLAEGIKDAVYKYELDGINVDIENMTGAEKTAYVDFVRLLKQKMPDKLVAVSVAAIQSDTYKTAWQKSYDYKALADNCDYLMIMAYDEHYQSGPPGPVSSMSFMENSIKYALNLGIAKEKLVLGMPFYGRIWSDSGGYPQGYGVSNAKIDQYIAAYRGRVVFDEASQSAKAVITIKASDTKPAMGGKTLAAGTYTIWFESERSMKEKLRLVTKYDIKGTGSWSLGQESENTWDNYKYWLNGLMFNDVPKSWARDYILNAYINNWITEYSEDLFGLDNFLTRAQAAAMLVRVLGLKVEANEDFRFDDCIGSWAEEYINTARKNNIISGTGKNMFSPDKPITRQEMAVMLNNILGYQSSGNVSFSDVSPAANTWAIEAIFALSEKGIITGFPDNTFRPLSNLTRAEMTALISRIKF